MTNPNNMQTAFTGERRGLFRLAFWTGLWTVLTLGVYRFWMKTRLRRHYWSSVRPGGAPLEYAGDPLEKLLGFLIAVVIVTFYICIINLLLMFGSLSLFSTHVAAYFVSFIGVLPLWFFARYRARRYVLARTRWRGIRFGLEHGAWGYAWRALLHWTATLATCGFWWPRMTFALEKYRTDRTFYGDVRLHQGGRPGMLYPVFVHVLIGGVLTASVIALANTGEPRLSWLLLVSIPWLLIGTAYYRVGSLRLMANAKSADGITLAARPDTTTVLRIYGFGYLATACIMLVPLMIIGVAYSLVERARMFTAFDPSGDPGVIFGVPAWVIAVLGVATYFAFFLLWSVFRHIYVTQPLWKHYAETLTIQGQNVLPNVQQRDRDHFREAEGFAEALDVGAAI